MKKTKDTYLTDLYKKLNDIDKKIEFQKIRSSTIDINDRTSTYEFIDKYQSTFGVRWLLNEFGISPSVYYNYLHSKNNGSRSSKRQILDEIRTLYNTHNGTDGYRKIHYYLTQKGYDISPETTRKYMNQELGLHSITRIKHPPYEKRSPFRAYPDLLNGDFSATKINEKWCINFTFIGLADGSIRYNCAIMDLYDRSIVASVCGDKMDSNLAVKTLDKALKFEKNMLPGTLIIHSDQGNEFTSKEFTSYCLKKGVKQSMSFPGHPHSNAPMERYFNTLKTELIYQNSYSSETDLYDAISNFAYTYYNKQRPHSYNNYKTPYAVRTSHK